MLSLASFFSRQLSALPDHIIQCQHLTDFLRSQSTPPVTVIEADKQANPPHKQPSVVFPTIVEGNQTSKGIKMQ